MENNKFLSRAKTQALIDNLKVKKDEGKQFLDGLAAKGYTIEGYNDKPKPVEQSTLSKVASGVTRSLEAGAKDVQTYGGAAAAYGIDNLVPKSLGGGQYGSYSDALNSVKQQEAAQQGPTSVTEALGGGRIKPSETVSEAAGRQMQLASWTPGAGALIKGAGAGAMIGKAALEGGLATGLNSAGSSLEAGNDARTVIKDGLVGGATGAAMGGGLTTVGKGVGAVAKGVGKGVKAVLPKVTNNVNAPVTALEQSYDDLFKTAGASVNKQFDKSLTKDFNPSKFLSSKGIVLGVEDGKVQTAAAKELIGNQAKEVDNLLTSGLGQVKQTVNLNDLEARALKQIDTAHFKAKGGDYKSMQNAIKSEIAAYRETFGDDISLSVLNDMKSAQWGNSSFDMTKSNATRDAHRNLGNVFKKEIEDVAAKNGVEGVADLNRYLGEHYDTLTMLDKIQGKAVKGGRLTNLAGIAAGAAVGASGLQSVTGGLAGMVVGGAGSSAVQKLKISNPVRNAALRKLETESHPAVDAFNQSLKKTVTAAPAKNASANQNITDNIISPILKQKEIVVKPYINTPRAEVPSGIRKYLPKNWDTLTKVAKNQAISAISNEIIKENRKK